METNKNDSIVIEPKYEHTEEYIFNGTFTEDYTLIKILCERMCRYMHKRRLTQDGKCKFGGVNYIYHICIIIFSLL